MNKELLNKLMWQGHYELKEGTSASFILSPYSYVEAIQSRSEKRQAIEDLVKQQQACGAEILLPLKVSFIAEDTAPVSNSGRGAKKKVMQMKAQFTQTEASPYKQARPFKVCTSIWAVEGHKCFFYGTIGITQAEEQKPMDNGDLVMFYTSDWREVDVFILRGLAKPNETANLQEVVDFIESKVLLG